MDLTLQKKRWRPELAPPEEEVVTEGQKQLKNLLDKQLQKDVTIQQQLSRKRTFTSASTHSSAINSLSGLTTLDHFQEVDQLDAYTEELKKCGLTEEEVQLKIMADNSHKQPVEQKKRHFGVDPTITEGKLKIIEEKIEKKKVELDQKDKFHGLKALTRHEMELERSLLRDCVSGEKLKVLSSLTTVLDPRDTTPSNNPMNQLPEILENITKGSNKAKLRRKQKQKKENSSSGWDSKTPANHTGVVTKGSLNYTSGDGPLEEDSLEAEGEVATCEPRPRSPVPEVSLEHINKHKLTIMEIKNLSRFNDYEPGEPSQILYVKNLSGKVHQEDLKSLFDKFSPEGSGGPEYRVMSGRMRGQAFITFQDVFSATHALECVNGYCLKGKPMIIQYGRKNSSINTS